MFSEFYVVQTYVFYDTYYAYTQLLLPAMSFLYGNCVFLVWIVWHCTLFNHCQGDDSDSNSNVDKSYFDTKKKSLQPRRLFKDAVGTTKGKYYP